MARKKRYDHLHKYQRVKLGKNYTVFRCIQPGCTHYIRKELAENNLCACNRCDEPMILTKAAMMLARPHCEDCTVKRDKTKHDKLRQLLAEKGV